MRGTTHNGRAGKDGAYSIKHNDRNFELENAPHINPEKMSDNWYWHRYQKSDPKLTFEQVEKRFYDDNFTNSLKAKNERYRVSGHNEHIKSMDEYRTNKISCPEETILQIGKLGDTVDKDTLRHICIEHINWEAKTFPNVKVLDVALHADEQGAPHIHERKVWVANSKDGLIVGQGKALEEMKIKRPHPEKKKDRYNNPKTTYTAMCRQHFLEICRQHGLELEVEPDKASKRGLELVEYKKQQEEAKLENVQNQVFDMADTLDEYRELASEASQDYSDTSKKLQIAQKQINILETHINSKKIELSDMRTNLELSEASLSKNQNQLEQVEYIAKIQKTAKIPDMRPQTLGKGVIVQDSIENIQLAYQAMAAQQLNQQLEHEARLKVKKAEKAAAKTINQAKQQAEAIIEKAYHQRDTVNEKLASIKLDDIQRYIPDLDTQVKRAKALEREQPHQHKHKHDLNR